MIEENLSLIGQKVKIISPKICLHLDMKHTITFRILSTPSVPMLNIVAIIGKKLAYNNETLSNMASNPE